MTDRSKPLRILFVIGSLNLGGTQRHLVRLADALVKRGIRVSFICLAETGDLAPEVIERGGRVLSPWIERNPQRPRCLRLFDLFANSLQLIGHLAVNRYHIVNLFLPEATIVGGIASWICRCPIRIANRRSLNFYRQRRPILGPLESFVLNQVTHGVMGNSRAVTDQLLEEGVPKEKIGLIYNGVPRVSSPKSREECRAKFLAPGDDDCLLLVMVANLIPYKGHVDLLKGLAEFNETYSESWRIYCLGEDSGILESLEELSLELKLTDHVMWEGGVPAIEDYLAAADIGLLVSHEEGFSNAILEGMAVGLPMVVTEVGGNSEAVVDGETGVVISPQTPNEIAAAIDLLARSPKLRDRMGANGRRRIVERFTLEGCVDQYERLYRGLATGETIREICGEDLIPSLNRDPAKM